MSKDSDSQILKLKNKFFELFGMDLRSLAALRIGTAIIVLLDLLTRSQDLVAHYTDLGLMPREAVLQDTNSAFISLYMANGSPLFITAMFLITGFFAILLLIGYKTRWVSIVLFILTLSLRNRNTMIVSGADDILRLILFWEMFLPLGAKYSVDSLKYFGRELPKQIFTAATACYLLQIAFIYIFTVQFKYGSEWRTEGSAVYYALSLWSFSTPFGQFLYQFPHIMKLLTFSTFWYEALGPILLFLPFYTKYIRTFAVFGFMTMHFGFGLGLDLGIFAYIVMIAFLGFLPSFFWEKLFSFFQKPKFTNLTIYYDNDCGLCQNAARTIKTFLLLPQTQVMAAESEKSILNDMVTHNSWVIVDHTNKRFFKFDGAIAIAKASPLAFIFAPILILKPFHFLGTKLYELVAMHRKKACPVNHPDEHSTLPTFSLSPVATLFCVVILEIVFLWNVVQLPNFPFELPNTLRQVAYTLGIHQNWNLFAPRPTLENILFVAPGNLANGSVVDVIRDGRNVSWDAVALGQLPRRSHRWGKYYSNLSHNEVEYYARYLCYDWNARHSDKDHLQSVEIYRLTRRTFLDYQAGPVNKESLLIHDCT